MDFKASPVIVEALQKRLNHGVFGYETVSSGLMPALSNWLAMRHNWEVNTDHILRAPNILNALAIAASVFTDQGDGVIVQPPVFFDFFDILRENHRSIVTNPLILKDGRYHMDFEDLERKASAPKTKMIYLCNPHNPIGRVWTKDELRTLGDICARHEVFVVADEIHGDITFSNYHYTPFASLGPEYAVQSITCLSPAKSFNIASCCSAFTVISNDQRRKQFQIENSRLTVNKNNAFANSAMEAAYLGGGPWLDGVLHYLEDNLRLVRDCLKSIPCVKLIEPEGTFLLWLDFRDMCFEPDELTSFLRKEAKWAVTRGQAFGEQGHGFVRLNIACTRQKLSDALNSLAKAISSRS